MTSGISQDMTARAKRLVAFVAYPLFLRVADYLPGYDRDYRRFAVVTPGRSGSTFLLQRLNSHPQINCFGEMLHQGKARFELPFVDHLDAEVEGVSENPMQFLERHVWRAHRKQFGAVGAKLIYMQILKLERRAELMDALRDVPVILLNRRDLIGMYLSQQRTARTQVFSHTGTDDLPQVTFAMNPAECEEFFESLSLCEKLYAALFSKGESLTLDYEDLTADPESYDAPLCDFLQVSHQPMIHRTRKMAKGSWRDQVTNVPEVEAHFEGSKWAAQLA